MKRLFAIALLALVSAAFGATTLPVQLLNPTGSTSGQAVISTGPGTAPSWGSVTAAALAAQAANTVVANVTGSTASPTAFAMPSCNTSTSALQWTSGTGFTCYASSATTTGTLAQFAATTSAQLAGVLSDETGTGVAVFSASPALTGTPTAPTATAGTNTTQIATTAFATTAVTNSNAIAGQPYFQAYLSSNQSATIGTLTKIQFNTKNFDSNSYYDNTTNFRFTPLKAGKYWVHAQIGCQSTLSAAGNYQTFAVIYKNGAIYISSRVDASSNGAATVFDSNNVSGIVSMNGTTDFLETFGEIGAAASGAYAGGTAPVASFFEAYYIGP